MNNDYLQDKLLKYIQVVCGVENKHTCFCDVIKGRFVFGYEKDGRQQVNRVTKQVAVLLAVEYHNFEQVHMGRETIKYKKVVRRRTK